jgi:hypothetical protein
VAPGLLRFARNDDVFGWCFDLTSTHHALAQMFQRGAFVHRNVTRLIALDFILRVTRAGVTRITFP